MRVLLVHNFHRSHKPSGEDVAYRRERDLLQASPVELHTYERSNDESAEYGLMDYLRVARKMPFDRAVYDDFLAALRRVRPDVVHVHNTFPLLTSAVFKACSDHGTPVVLTLHNYYLFCAAGTCMRDGAVCRLCMETRNPLHGVRFGCYNGSRLATVPVWNMIRQNWLQGYWRTHIDGFIALTAFGKRIFVEAGLPDERIYVKPHYVPEPSVPEAGSGDGSGYLLFVGRLSPEKGIDTLIEAARRIDVPVKIAGTGPEGARVARAVADLPHVELLGQITHEQAYDLMRRSLGLVFPSVGIETFGLSVVESFACSAPVVATDLGSMPELVAHGENGLLFEAGNAGALVDAVQRLRRPGERDRMGQAARQTYERRFTAQQNLDLLLSIYESVIARRPTPAAHQPTVAGGTR